MVRFAWSLVIAVAILRGSLVRDSTQSDEARFQAYSRLVLLPVTVVDSHGALLSGLSANSFVVRQDHVPRPIVSFATDDAPVSVGIVFDTSGSMTPVLGKARMLLQSMLREANQQDEAFLFTVSTRPRLELPFTSDFGTLLSRSIFLRAGGGTALVDTICEALQSCRLGRNQRRALVVVSDGRDNRSRHSTAELMALAEESDVRVHSLTVFDAGQRKPIELSEERAGIRFLSELSRRTGGMQIIMRGEAAEISEAAGRVGRALREEYVLGYRPEEVTREGSSEKDVESKGRWHPVDVQVRVPGARAFSRAAIRIDP